MRSQAQRTSRRAMPAPGTDRTPTTRNSASLGKQSAPSDLPEGPIFSCLDPLPHTDPMRSRNHPARKRNLHRDGRRATGEPDGVAPQRSSASAGPASKSADGEADEQG